MSRLPIRLRLTLAFAAAMALVLVATGVFLYLRLGSSLEEAIDESLQARTAEVTPLVARGESVPADGDPDERFVQVLDPGGGVVDGTTRLDEPVLEPAAVADASRSVRWFVLDEVEGIDGRVRALATPVDTPDGTLVLLVGASLEDRDDAVQELLALLLVVGPVALVLASLLGYGLATLALRPVESMRAEAAAISATEPGRRLPLPQARDEVQRLGETLNRMLDRLEAAFERERSFVADASHELRTPIALLKTELELALRRPRSEAELGEALRSAAAETDRLAQLADDLLLLARSDEGKLALDLAPVSARDVLTSVAARFARRADEAGRQIELDAPEALELRADSVRLEQALADLVENALRHGAGSIHLTAAESDDRVELHVLDGGSGFAPEFLPHAFDRFSRADSARSGDGAGLGLTIADVIARAHGGSAHAANREGGGADVWVSLPV
jgi:heavy metal sensor kinase